MTTMPTLDAETTPAGCMERLFLIETQSPAYVGAYNEVDSLKAMRLMRQVVENRLKASAQWGARDAKDEIDVIAIGTQFAGFADYPTLPAGLKSLVLETLRLANSPNDPRSADYAQFVRDAITAATEPTSPQGAVPNLVAWRTSNAKIKSPGPRFKEYMVVQGNRFFTVDPVPPMPKHKAHKHEHRRH